jgi:hypothetical protein
MCNNGAERQKTLAGPVAVFGDNVHCYLMRSLPGSNLLQLVSFKLSVLLDDASHFNILSYPSLLTVDDIYVDHACDLPPVRVSAPGFYARPRPGS